MKTLLTILFVAHIIWHVVLGGAVLAWLCDKAWWVLWGKKKDVYIRKGWRK